MKKDLEDFLRLLILHGGACSFPAGSRFSASALECERVGLVRLNTQGGQVEARIWNYAPRFTRSPFDQDA